MGTNTRQRRYRARVESVHVPSKQGTHTAAYRNTGQTDQTDSNKIKGFFQVWIDRGLPGVHSMERELAIAEPPCTYRTRIEQHLRDDQDNRVQIAYAMMTFTRKDKAQMGQYLPKLRIRTQETTHDELSQMSQGQSSSSRDPHGSTDAALHSGQPSRPGSGTIPVIYATASAQIQQQMQSEDNREDQQLSQTKRKMDSQDMSAIGHYTGITWGGQVDTPPVKDECEQSNRDRDQVEYATCSSNYSG